MASGDMTELLDWLCLILLIILVVCGDSYYFLVISNETSILMNLMKYLIFNEVVASLLLLIHDIPSYFMEQPVSVYCKR